MWGLLVVSLAWHGSLGPGQAFTRLVRQALCYIGGTRATGPQKTWLLVAAVETTADGLRNDVAQASGSQTVLGKPFPRRLLTRRDTPVGGDDHPLPRHPVTRPATHPILPGRVANREVHRAALREQLEPAPDRGQLVFPPGPCVTVLRDLLQPRFPASQPVQLTLMQQPVEPFTRSGFQLLGPRHLSRTPRLLPGLPAPLAGRDVPLRLRRRVRHGQNLLP